MTSGINYNLPVIDIDTIDCTEEEREVIRDITHVSKDGKTLLRGTKPKNGESAWVWRKVMQLVSPEEKFWVASKAIDDYLNPDSDVGKLSEIVDKVVSRIGVLPGKDEWVTAHPPH